MSTLLSSDDLNDFITPSVACIKPVEPQKTQEKSSIRLDTDGDAALEVFVDGTAKSLEPAQISLSDCLACSGCITSAEEILVAQHSHKELLTKLKENTDDRLKFVASVSHQSRASLAHAFGTLIEHMDLVLIDLFVNKLGFKYIVGTELGRLLSLHRLFKEIEEYKNVDHKGPLMGSVCPGWVLYVEKTHPEMLPNMSLVKSPQQITGHLLKKSASAALEVPIDQIYHLSVMPCFDKKLEAARPEDGKDVDCVITAKELVQLISDEGLSFETYIQEVKQKSDFETLTSRIDSVYMKNAPKLFKFGPESWYLNLGSASGGYAASYIEYLQRTHSDKNTEVVEVKGRNEDIFEYRLQEVESGEKLGSVGVVNGFRNIQNLIRKVKDLKTGKKKKVGGLAARRKARLGAPSQKEVALAIECGFVEVMACPGGCINGGGQISAPGGGVASGNANKVWTQETEDVYKSIKTIADVNETSLVNSLETYIKEFGEYFGVLQQRLMETKFNEVISQPIEDTAIALTSKW